MLNDLNSLRPAPHERLAQMHQMLEANKVPRPHILWIRGDLLVAFMESINKVPFWRDGRIESAQLYRYNLHTGRYSHVEPRPQEYHGNSR